MSGPEIRPSEDDERLDDGAAEAAPVEPAPAWLIDFRRSDHRRGFYQSLGNHALVFAERGTDHLVVSFDNLSSAREDRIEREPWGYGFVAKNGWSHLGVMAFRPDWFRDPDLFAALEHLRDAGFFRRFHSVTLMGTSMGGYAACALAGLAPGCRVIAFSPQSTLRADLVPWEERFAAGRRADWDGPYADAAVEAGAADKVWLVYDPHFAPDRQHVERFSGPNIHPLRARHGGHKTALVLRRAEILSEIVRQVVEDKLTERRFYGMYRRVRHLPWFLASLSDSMLARGRFGLSTRLIHYLRRRGQGFAAHNLRKKHSQVAGSDPLMPAGASRRPVDQQGA